MSVETTIRALRRQLRDIEQQRAKLAEAIRALEELPGTTAANDDGTSAVRKRRAGASPLVDAALAALRTATKPMPIVELVAAIQKTGFQANRPPSKLRASLVSALLRRTDLFSKPGRGVYGLVE